MGGVKVHKRAGSHAQQAEKEPGPGIINDSRPAEQATLGDQPQGAVEKKQQA